jgi:hypothetical protein
MRRRSSPSGMRARPAAVPCGSIRRSAPTAGVPWLSFSCPACGQVGSLDLAQDRSAPGRSDLRQHSIGVVSACSPNAPFCMISRCFTARSNEALLVRPLTMQRRDGRPSGRLPRARERAALPDWTASRNPARVLLVFAVCRTGSPSSGTAAPVGRSPRARRGRHLGREVPTKRKAPRLAGRK